MEEKQMMNWYKKIKEQVLSAGKLVGLIGLMLSCEQSSVPSSASEAKNQFLNKYPNAIVKVDSIYVDSDSTRRIRYLLDDENGMPVASMFTYDRHSDGTIGIVETYEGQPINEQKAVYFNEKTGIYEKTKVVYP
ncbi:hypothetical protein CL617_01440 [archaeon]|jgi:hypothetical protein|nr:hypothetical protein [archaeon]|tara:strand:+ start:11350 stop:11751 length:402 start_codon:yes stop_codon:yes gene_type:complete